MHRISEILNNDPPMHKRVKEFTLWREWAELVGPRVAMHCKPERMRDKLLVLKVDSSAWMQQLQFMKALIIEKINGRMGKEFVADIRFNLGSFPLNQGKVKVMPDLPPLGRDTLTRIEKDFSGINDPDLKEILLRARSLDIQHKEFRKRISRGGSSTGSSL